MIKLISEPYDIVTEKIDYIMGHEKGIKEIFYSKRKRLQCSKIATLICNDEQIIGFLNVVDQGIDNLLFVDGGIINKYRGNGYGTASLKLLVEKNIFKEYLISETQNTNVLGNASASRIGDLVLSTNNKNYYLLQRGKTKEFLNSQEFTDLQEFVEEPKIKRLTI